jgi:hypothetical protein
MTDDITAMIEQGTKLAEASTFNFPTLRTLMKLFPDDGPFIATVQDIMPDIKEFKAEDSYG